MESGKQRGGLQGTVDSKKMRPRVRAGFGTCWHTSWQKVSQNQLALVTSVPIVYLKACLLPWVLVPLSSGPRRLLTPR